VFPLNRLVALLTPVFSAVAAVGTAYAARHFPGLPPISPSTVVPIEITAFTGATAAALKWLHGHQGYEKIVAEAEKVDTLVRAELAREGVKVPSDSELVKIAEEKAHTLTEQLASAIEGQKAAQIQVSAARKAACAAESRLAQVSAALHVKGDPNLVLPDTTSITPQVEEQAPVAPDVVSPSEQVETQPPVAPDAVSITPQTQQT